MMIFGGGALATAVVGAIVATAVVSSGGGSSGGSSGGKPQRLPSPADLPSQDAQPDPSFPKVRPPAPPKPGDFISSAEKDTAPLSADTLFPGKTLLVGPRSYRKGATAGTGRCATAASDRLAPALTGNDCTEVIRATYTRDGVAVTVGVAVFDTEAQAVEAEKDSRGNIQSLPGSGVPTFCRVTVCRLTTNSIGRYVYFTVAGYTNGKDVPESDARARQAADDVAGFTFRRIVQRGEDQAAASVTASP
jgi:hypothetical protein